MLGIFWYGYDVGIISKLRFKLSDFDSLVVVGGRI